MTTDKQVNLAQLQAEATALPSSTHTHGFVLAGSPTDANGIAPVGDALACVNTDGSHDDALCASAQTAYAAHVAHGPNPTRLVVASGAGTGASVVLHQPDPSMSTDVRLIADVTIGTTPTADANGHYPLVNVTFGTPYPMAPLGVMVDRVGANAVALGLVFSDSLATTGYTLIAQNAPVAGQTYRLSAALG